MFLSPAYELMYICIITVILLDKSQHSQYFTRVLKYMEILMVTGLPSEANQYWRNLRELKRTLLCFQ